MDSVTRVRALEQPWQLTNAMMNSVVVISNAKLKSLPAMIHIDGETIKLEGNFKYLGWTITSDEMSCRETVDLVSVSSS